MQYSEILSAIPQLSKVAEHLVHYCLRVQEGELVQLIAGIHQYPLVAQISVEIDKAGGHSFIKILDDATSVAKVNEIPESYLGKEHPALVAMEKSADVKLSISPVFDPATEREKDISRLAAINRGKSRRDETSKTRCLGMEWPTPAKAKIYGFSPQQFADLYWHAFWVDLDQLTKTAVGIRARLREAKKVTITSADGSEMTLSIGPRPIWMDAGCFSQDLIAVGDLTKNLPCGEVYCSPLEESANGTVLFQNVFVQGQWIRDLKVTFRNGRVIDACAREGVELFESILQQHTGDKDCIAELGIGINPNVPRVMGNTLLDEKVLGSIHIALGHNTMYGGTNVSSLHWDLISMGPTVVVDDSPLMIEGHLSLS